MRFLILGRSVGKGKKKNWKRSLELGGPVPQHNIRGAWKQQGVVTKSTWRQWKKEKSTSLLRLCSHGTGPKWIRPYPGTDYFCSHGTVPLINVCPHGTGLLLFGTESKLQKQLFLPVKHAQNTRCSFQNGAEVPKGTGPGVYTVTDPPKRTGPGVYTVTDPFGTGTVPKTGPAFLEAQFSDLGPVSRKTR